MTIARILATKGRDVTASQPHRTLGEAARVLADKAIGAIIVTDSDGALQGILSERDIVRALARHGAEAMDHPVSRYMTTKVVTTTQESSVVAVMEQMTTGRFRHIPVMRAGKLDGLISIGDVVKYRLAEIEGESEALKQYIASA